MVLWSPDSKKIALTDKRMNLWLVDVEMGTKTKVDSDLFDTPLSSLDPAWSADSRWIAYAKRLENQFHALFVYDVVAGRAHQLTDGLSDATWPAFRSYTLVWE